LPLFIIFCDAGNVVEDDICNRQKVFRNQKQRFFADYSSKPQKQALFISNRFLWFA
jgi:hypothetical protein